MKYKQGDFSLKVGKMNGICFPFPAHVTVVMAAEVP